MPHQFPFAGQILVSGASHTRLQLTILGDDTSRLLPGKVRSRSGSIQAPARKIAIAVERAGSRWCGW